MPVSPELLEILVCPACKDVPVVLVNNDTGLKCGRCQRVYPDQGRHPGDAHRRGDDRRRAGRVLRPSPEDPAHPPAADRRRRADDAGHPRAPARPSRRAPAPTWSSRTAAPVVAGNPHLDDVIVAPLLRGAARAARRRARWRCGCAAAVRRGHRLPRRPAQFAAGLATGAPARIGYTIAGRSWMYTTQVPTAARPPAAALGREPVGPARGAAARPRPAGARDATRSRWPRTPPPRGARRRPAARPGHRPVRTNSSSSTSAPATSSGGGPKPSFADVAAALASRGGRIVVSSSRPAPAQAARAEAVRRLGRSRAACRPAPIVGRLRPGSGRTAQPGRRGRALFVGGDSGPAHIAVDDDDADGRASTGRRPRRCGGRGGTPALPTETVDVGALPCRPCDQRVCEPGDFRCLRGIDARRGDGRRRSRAMRAGTGTGAESLTV